MAIRRLNFTGRLRLRRRDVHIQVRGLGGVQSFDANLNLDGYDLPPDALLFVEPYRQVTSMRFSHGTVGRPTPPQDRALTEFETPDGVRFRIKVVQRGPSGLILAEADQIRPEILDQEETPRTSLLHVRPADLQHEVFKLDFENEPILLVNETVANWRDVPLQPAWRSLAAPVVLREILVRILCIDEYFDLDDLDDWHAQWLQFTRGLPGVAPLPEEREHDQINEWIDDAVSAFCRHHRMMDQFVAYWAEEDSE